MKRLCTLKGLRMLMVLVTGTLMACSTVDCPLNNAVYCNYLLKGKVKTLTDVLTISTTRQNRKDSVLINQQTKTDSFSLPMSYAQDEDILYFKTKEIKDTVWIKKTNHPHFESVDCGLNYFHTITGVRYTQHAIDSITINHQEVTYDASKQHLYIYFKEYRF